MLYEIERCIWFCSFLLNWDGAILAHKKYYLNQSISEFFNSLHFSMGKNCSYLRKVNYFLVSLRFFLFFDCLHLGCGLHTFMQIPKNLDIFIFSCFHFHINSQFIVAKWFFFWFLHDWKNLINSMHII